MLIARLQAGPLRLQAQAKDTASSKASPAAAAGGTAERFISKRRQQSKTAAAAAADKPRRSQPYTRRREASAVPKQRQWWQQQHVLVVSDHNDKHVPAPFQGAKGDLTFTGELRFAATHREANAWLDELLQLADACSSSSSSSSGPLVVGIDTETAVTWGQQQRHTPTSLLQLCYHAAGSPQPVCLLLPLHRLGLSPGLLRVLQHPGILKVGIGVAHDMIDLLRSYEVEGSVQGMLDLSWLASQAGVLKEGSAQDAERQQAMQQAGIKTFQQPLQWGLAGLLQATSEFSLAKSKRVTMSNWAQVPLSEKQLQYAACDAYAGLMSFHTLWLVWLQQQPVAAAATVSSEQQLMAISGSSTQGSVGSPVARAAEFEGLLDWLLDDDQQQQQQQQQQSQQQQQPAVVTTLLEPPAATSSSSTSSSSTSTSSSSSSQLGDNKQPQMPFTVQKRHLTDGAFWCSYAPAVHQQRQWQQLLQHGMKAAQLQYENMLANALDKAAAGDGSDYDLVGAGAPVVDASADAAAGGMMWP